MLFRSENGAKKFEKSFLNYIYQIIENLSKKFLQKQNKVLDIPAILPLCDGSIDIHWKKNSEYDILINIPPLNEARRNNFWNYIFSLNYQGRFQDTVSLSDSFSVSC